MEYIFVLLDCLFFKHLYVITRQPDNDMIDDMEIIFGGILSQFAKMGQIC